MDPTVVYLTFQAIQSLSPDDLARAGTFLRHEDEETCVWLGDVGNVLKASLDVQRKDLMVAARAALEEFDSVMLRAGLIGEVREVVACSEKAQLVINGPDLQGLHRRGGQTYCDWCMEVLTSESIATSEQVGLAKEFAWACGTCLVNGTTESPPEGWEPPDSEWPFRDS